MAQTGPAAPSRSVGIDLARGLAVVLMIQTHAFDGWAAPQAKAGWGYALSRAFANIPAPLFLLLAGVGLSLAMSAAHKRGVPTAAARKSLAGRGLQVVGYGYLVSLIYVVIEGTWGSAAVSALLRADILHCIGLSMLVCTFLLLGRTHLALRAAGLATFAILAAVALGRWVSPPTGWLAVPAALLFDVAPYTRFPLLPLCGFTAVGVAIGDWLQRRPPSLRLSVFLSALLVAMVPLWQHLTVITVAALGGRLSRSHPAVAWNFLEGCTRALAVLLVGLAVAQLGAWRSATRLTTWLVRLGRGSLLAYAVHIPLCYGRLARPIAHRLDMPLATVLVLALIAFTYAVIWVRDRARGAASARSQPAR